MWFIERSTSVAMLSILFAKRSRKDKPAAPPPGPGGGAAPPLPCEALIRRSSCRDNGPRQHMMRIGEPLRPYLDRVTEPALGLAQDPEDI